MTGPAKAAGQGGVVYLTSQKDPSLFDGPPRSTPLPQLAEALTDPRVKPLSPGKMTIPAEVLRELESARKIRIGGHIAPDGDAVGCVLGLTRLLRSRGKDALAIIDDEVQGGLRRLAMPGELLRYSQVPEGDVDLVVLVDVAGLDRIGQFAEDVKRARSVLVIDHHTTGPTRESLQLAPGARLTRWVESGADAAALLVAGVAERMRKGVDGMDAELVRDIYKPLALGTLTDTGFFSYPGLDDASLWMFKFIFETVGMDLDALKDEIKYEVPEEAVGLLANPPYICGVLEKPEGEGVRRKLEALADPASWVQTRIAPDDSYALIMVPGDIYDLALDAAKLTDAEVVRSDVFQELRAQASAALQGDTPEGRKLCVLLTRDNADDKVFLSARSADAGPALDIASEFGGGGHPRAAGARIRGSLGHATARTEDWLARNPLS